MRVIQKRGDRGSLKWIQRAVNTSPALGLDTLILPFLDHASSITWISPLASDEFAEYRDADFLGRVGVPHLAHALAEFWPSRGPQWDALGRSDKNDIVLVEAKAHVKELCSPGSQAGPDSKRQIQASLDGVISGLGANPRAPWIDVFYQLANRIAHLDFLRRNGARAWLVLVNFVGAADVEGPNSAAEWDAAYEVVWHVLGVPKRHPLSPYIVHVYPNAI